MKRYALPTLFAAAAMLLSVPVLAQQRPDAGQTLQQLREPQGEVRRGGGLVLEAPAGEKLAPGGPSVMVRKVEFHGNTVFSDAELKAMLGDVEGKPYDLAGMKAIAERVSEHYRSHGYPFAQALVPVQQAGSGTLRIEIVEGRYGAVKAVGERAEAAQRFLAPLKPGEVIAGAPLERATLLLDDQPGCRTVPVMRPGKDVGTGDLEVKVEREKRYGGKVRADNYGNRFTGRSRASVDLYANSPFMFGDQFTLSTLYTMEDMWYGALGYNLPLGALGLRGHAGYARTYYELGKDFATLNAQGTADVASIGASYPLMRAQKANLTLDVTYQRKWLNDKQNNGSSDDSKYSDSVPVTLSFDRRDALLNGGVTYGTLGWTPGRLRLDSGLKATDVTTAQTHGTYNKFNADLARLQALPAKFALFGRFSAQQADGNLDSSESFGLGGPNAVRAYPTGEGYGDAGWISQAELRYDLAPFTPYAFYDAGRVIINESPWTTGANHRSGGGAGLGMRFLMDQWNADISAAWRTHGGPPQSDGKDRIPVMWVNAGYSF